MLHDQTLAKQQRARQVKKLLEDEALIDAASYEGKTALHYAAELPEENFRVLWDPMIEVHGHVDIEICIQNMMTNYPETPLNIAAQQGNLKTALKLLDFGADIRTTDNNGDNIFHKLVSAFDEQQQNKNKEAIGPIFLREKTSRHLDTVYHLLGQQNKQGWTPLQPLETPDGHNNMALVEELSQVAKANRPRERRPN